jgi:4-alpha-glucanotransferase
VKKALETFSKENKEALQKVRFLQFLFFRQWKQLKQYCNQRNIQLIGDLPFYVSYDSADVWLQRDIFKLDEKGDRLGLAGVPPDAFSADGQLWGMPVFRWDVLKERNYDWWINRLRKNTALFDLVRLDHFRAFADYWEVPAGETTSRNGQWIPGPGAHFFEVLKEQLGGLPFVAEDLGDINDDVLSLRDDYKLPGMKILQFAFGDDNGVSDYLPHNFSSNFFVYTGTHDNNTTKGWYRQEADELTRKRLQQYLGIKVGEENVSFYLSRVAYSSVADNAIIPLQDVIQLNEAARMNIPASGENNWAWRLFPGQVTNEHAQLLKEWTQTFNRL